MPGKSGDSSAQQLADRYDIDLQSAATLLRYGFSPDTFDRLRQRLVDNVDPTARLDANRIQAAAVTPPLPNDLVKLPASGTTEAAELAAQGMEAIAAGKVAVLLLAGGMATRFGGKVKALVEVEAGLTFVDAKLKDLQVLADRIRQQTGPGRQPGQAHPVPMWLMTSFRTDAALREWAQNAQAAQGSPGTPGSPGSQDPQGTPSPSISLAPQSVSIRLRMDGGLYRDPDGSVSLYAPGHGDTSEALQSSGLLSDFISRGGEHVFISNVDNVAATLNPAVIGAHRRSGAAITSEIAAGSEVGGAPWRVNDKLQIVERFRLPPGFESGGAAVEDAGASATNYVNTNSLVVDAKTLAADYPLTWFEVHKNLSDTQATDTAAADTQVVQFERLIGELTAFVETTMLLVEPGGADGRFLPVKDPSELAQRSEQIRMVLAERGIAGC